MIRCRDGCHIFRSSVCNLSLSAYWPLFKEDGKWDSRASLLSFSLSLWHQLLLHSLWCWLASGGGGVGGVWSLWRCKNPSHFLWWYAKIPRVVSTAPFLRQPSPSLSSHQPSAAPENVEVTEEEETDWKPSDFHYWISFFPSILRCAGFSGICMYKWSECRWQFLSFHVNAHHRKCRPG